MKLDNEQMLRHSNIGFKSDSKPYSFISDTKPFENREKPLDSTGLNTEGNVRENQNGVVHDIKETDGDSDPLYLENTKDEWPASKLDSSVNVNDFANGNEKEFSDFVTSNSHPSKKMDSLQGSVFYLDKSVMECELPELVVCYKERTYHVVKDICIDEGVPTQDKFLFESEMDEKSHNFLPSEKDQDCKLVKEKLESNMCMQDVSLSSEDKKSCEDIDNECDSNKKVDPHTCRQDESNNGVESQCDSENFTLTREGKDEEMKMITDDASKELITLGELLSIPELSTVNIKDMPSDWKIEGIEQQPFQSSSEKEVTVTPPLVSTIEESNNILEEAMQSAAALPSAAKESDNVKGDTILISPAQVSVSEESTNSSLANEVSDDGRLENESITFNFDSSAPTQSKEECGQNLGCEPPETGSKLLQLEDTSYQPISDSLRHGTGESSFSAMGPVTGLITYSGPIAYSGSLSVRSDSSTTSTRSFAFPVLQSEWNSSPVRMAKADRRHYRKHRGWRHSILCCRF